MADPISALGLAFQLVEVVDLLYKYGSAVKDSRREIARLATELSALQGILNQIDRLRTVKGNGHVVFRLE